MKSALFILFISYSSFIVNGQTSIGKITKTDGSIIKIYQTKDRFGTTQGISMKDGTIYYYDSIGHSKFISQHKIKSMQVEDKYFITLPINSAGQKGLQQVIAENSDYFMTNYFGFGGGHYLNIFKRSDTTEVMLREHHSANPNNDRNLLIQISPYFADCPQLLAIMKENTEKTNNYLAGYNAMAFLSGINNYKCK